MNAITDAIAVLRAERAKIDDLIGLLEQHAGVAAPKPSKRGHQGEGGGHPVIDPTDQRRAKKAEAMRNRRARLKASAAPAVPTTSEPAEADPETKAKAAKLLKLREAAKEKAKYEHEWQDRMAAAESMNT
jgi:hypothetical protein